VVIKINVLERVSSVGACYLLARYQYRGMPKISLVNEFQCGTGTEWRDLIGQHVALILWLLQGFGRRWVSVESV